MSAFWSGLRLFLWLTLITGIIYPLVITGFAQIVFPKKANGQIVEVKGKIVGSALIGQKFVSDKYFWGRPSAVDYNPLPSGGSNLGPTSKVLKKAIEERKEIIIKGHGNEENIPVELLFASGSGLDPHISPKAARYQIERIAKARGLDHEEGRKMLSELVERYIERRRFRLLGPSTVNVLLLNQALDERTGQ